MLTIIIRSVHSHFGDDATRWSQFENPNPTRMHYLSLHWSCFFFSLIGATFGFFLHLFNSAHVFAQNSPGAFDAKGAVIPAVEFWGGGGVACASLSLVSVHLWALVSRSAAARQAALIGTATLFFSMALLWFARGHQVGNHNVNGIVASNVALASVFVLGALVIPTNAKSVKEQ